MIGVEQREQFGLFYQDMVNGIRAALPPGSELQGGPGAGGRERVRTSSV